MALTNIPLEELTEAHIRSLISANAPEALHIEYKRDTYGTNDEARREFLADVSSFANARGGDLLIGVAASKGVPSPFPGDADAEKVRLDSMARSGLEPRIPNLRLQAIPIASGGHVLVIRTPRSYRAPHRVIFKGLNRFWARSSAGKYEPNVDELRALFAFAPELAERMRAFRFDRVASIAAGDTPVPLMDETPLVLHVVPFSHFDLRPSLSLPEVIKHARIVLPMGTRHPADWHINFDGFLTLSNPNDRGLSRAYVQVFRAGAIESVVTSLVHSEGQIALQALDQHIVHHARIYAMLLDECGAEPPFTVMASMLGVKGTVIAALDNWHQWRGQPSDRDQLHLGEVVLDQVPDGDPSCARALRPLLDQLANAAGLPASVSFDRNGDWASR